MKKTSNHRFKNTSDSKAKSKKGIRKEMYFWIRHSEIAMKVM